MRREAGGTQKQMPPVKKDQLWLKFRSTRAGCRNVGLFNFFDIDPKFFWHFKDNIFFTTNQFYRGFTTKLP